jgi:hypothetical protein
MSCNFKISINKSSVKCLQGTLFSVNRYFKHHFMLIGVQTKMPSNIPRPTHTYNRTQ